MRPGPGVSTLAVFNRTDLQRSVLVYLFRRKQKCHVTPGLLAYRLSGSLTLTLTLTRSLGPRIATCCIITHP